MPRTSVFSLRSTAAVPLTRMSRLSARPLADRLMWLVCQATAVSVILLAVALVVALVWHSRLSLQTNGLEFFTQTTWDPEESHRVFGSLAFVYGTLASSALAMCLAIPLGVGTAAYLSEIAPPWLRRVGSFLVEMLAAVPSVVYGFWGMFVLGPSLQQLVSAVGGPNFGGVGILPAGLILAIMTVPYVTAVSCDVCRAVPASQREAALALGATRWQTIWSVVIPFARPGIIGGCFIALGRAVGETMAVTMLIGNSPVIQLSLFAKGDTIASAIANQFTEATYDLYLSALIELGLTLFLATIVINSLARLLIMRIGRSSARPWIFRQRLPSGRLRSVSSIFESPKRQARCADRARKINQIMTVVLCLCLGVTLVPLFLILGYLVYQGFGALNWSFFTNLPTAVGVAGGGMANALVGSALLVGVATLLAVPVGLLGAISLTEYRHQRLASAVRFVGELLSGVPSIVVGIFAYLMIVRGSGDFFDAPGMYGWSGACALAVMMVPIIMRASEEALKVVPPSLRHASYALGANQWQTLTRVTAPAALPAIVTAVFLAVARVVGESAPLLLTAGSNRFWPQSLNDYTPSLPVYIFHYANSPYDDWHRQAWAAALVLLIVVMGLNMGIRLMVGNRTTGGG